jgi:hypothetical protein
LALNTALLVSMKLSDPRNTGGIFRCRLPPFLALILVSGLISATVSLPPSNAFSTSGPVVPGLIAAMIWKNAAKRSWNLPRDHRNRRARPAFDFFARVSLPLLLLAIVVFIASRIMQILEIIWTFFKIGIVSFGGGCPSSASSATKWCPAGRRTGLPLAHRHSPVDAGPYSAQRRHHDWLGTRRFLFGPGGYHFRGDFSRYRHPRRFLPGAFLEVARRGAQRVAEDWQHSHDAHGALGAEADLGRSSASGHGVGSLRGGRFYKGKRPMGHSRIGSAQRDRRAGDTALLGIGG